MGNTLNPGFNYSMIDCDPGFLVTDIYIIGGPSHRIILKGYTENGRKYVRTNPNFLMINKKYNHFPYDKTTVEECINIVKKSAEKNIHRKRVVVKDVINRKKRRIGIHVFID